MMKVNKPEALGERTVLTIARDALSHPSTPTVFGSLLVIPYEDPPLKSIHPTQRTRVPSTTELGLDTANPLSPKVS